LKIGPPAAYVAASFFSEKGAVMTRRDMIKLLGTMVGLAAGVPPVKRAAARSQGLAAIGEALVSLSPSEAETLRAIIARIIPADENGPGALEARADRFIDRALAGALKNQKGAYTAGLAAVDAYARSSKGAVFARLSPADKDAVLTEMQANQATGFAGGSAQFFNLVRTNTIQGTFSDPFYGGNENFIGWELIGYPGSRIAVSANLQRMDVKPEPSRKSAYDYGMFSTGEV
jgi:gluconate 2-dehydrogenase gamma chain